MSASNRGSLCHEDYTVGWLTAVLPEQNAAKVLLDEEHEHLPTKEHDDNNYTLGRMGMHNIVIARPSVYGTNSAANTATNMLRTFQNLRFILMVGIGGGAPALPDPDDSLQDIRLGDVVVGFPKASHVGVIQYDMGKLHDGGRFTVRSDLGKPPKILLTAAGTLQSQHDFEEGMIYEYLKAALDKMQTMKRLKTRYRFPGRDKDRLFKTGYHHVCETASDCSSCDPKQTVKRVPRETDDPAVHYGLIASGNTVMKSAQHRDELRDTENVCCFEMEAAGLVDNVPCLVIRGICDYSDDHKNDAWQPYAALAAAAYGKDLLRVIQPKEVESTKAIVQIVGDLQDSVHTIKDSVDKAREENSAVERQRLKDQAQHRLEALMAQVDYPYELNYSLKDAALAWRQSGTCEWLFQDAAFREWESESSSYPVLWLKGKHGTGKSVLCASTIEHIQERHGDSSAVFIFITKALDISRNELLRHLAHQLLQNLRDDAPEMPSYLEEYTRISKHNSNLLERLIQTLLANRPRTFIFLDGLDEAEYYNGSQGTKSALLINSKEPEMEDFIQFLIRQARSGKTRLWCSSQETSTVKRCLHGCNPLGLELTKDNIHRDILKYLQSAIPSVVKEDGFPEIILRSAMSEHVDESFLYAHTLVDELKRAKDVKAKMRLVNAVPKTLKDQYMIIMDRIIKKGEEENLQDNELPTWKLVLSLVVFAKRPLRISEVKEAVAILRTASANNLDVQSRPYTDSVLDACLSFVRVMTSKGKPEDEATILVSHSAVRKFFLEESATGEGNKNDDGALVSSNVISDCCLRYLSQPKYSILLKEIEPRIFITGEGSGEAISGHCLLSYAAKYWHRHFDTPVEKGKNEEDISPTHKDHEAVENFLCSPNFVTCVQVQSLCVAGHFMQRYDTVTDELIKTKRVLPNWMYGSQLFNEYGDFTSEWGELLQCGSSEQVNGELDRCLWKALGDDNFLANHRSLYRYSILSEDHLRGIKEKIWRIQKLSSDENYLITSTLCPAQSAEEIHIEQWRLNDTNEPAVALTRQLKFSKDQVGLDSYGMPGAKPFPLIPSLRCMTSADAFSVFQTESLIRIGSRFFDCPSTGPVNTSAATVEESFLTDSWEQLCSQGNILVACRRRVPKEETSSTNYSTFGNPLQSDNDEPVTPDTDSESESGQSLAGEESWSEDSSNSGPPSSDDTFSSNYEPLGDGSSLDDDFEIESQVSFSAKPSDSDDIESNDVDSDSGIDSISDLSPESPREVPIENQFYDPNDSDNVSFESGSSLARDRTKEAQALASTMDNPFPVFIAEQQGNRLCDRCDKLIKKRGYVCRICDGGSFDLCHGCERRGRWCKNRGHRLYDMLNRRAIGVISKSDFFPRQDLNVYDTSSSQMKLVFKYRKEHYGMLHDSPPAIHPREPLVVWALTGTQLLFADFQNKTWFEQRIESGKNRGQPVCLNLSFSPCGTLLRLSKIEAVVDDVPTLRLGSKLPLEPRLHLVLHIIVLKLSTGKPTRSPPRLLGTTSLRIGYCEKPLVYCLPFTFTWRPTELYVTVSSARLRVYRVDLAQVASHHPAPHRPPGRNRRSPGNNASGKDRGVQKDRVVLTPKHSIFLPRSARNRTVQFIPPDNSRKMATVVIGPRYGQKSSPGIVLYLTDQDLGEWVSIEEKEGDEARLYHERQRLGGPSEAFDVEEDCDIIPVEPETWGPEEEPEDEATTSACPTM